MPPPDGYFGFDFPTPLDFAAQAKAYGMRGERITSPDKLRPALQSAIDANEPAVLDVVIDGAV